MAKFAIECPKCGSINTASTFIFAKKAIQCATCKTEINVKQSRLTSKQCPHCQKVFVYDQAKATKRSCPSCGKEIMNVAAADTMKYSIKRINCPQCACSIEVDETKEIADCPICDYRLDIKRELLRAEQVKTGGISVIQYEGDNSTFIWKHPIEDFNLGSQLNVHESQEAIFFLNGEALDTFGPGRHTLETQNLPILKQIYSMPEGSQSPFHAEVYFINKTVQMGIKWGTDSRVRFIDPVTGIPLDIGASGELNLQVSDGRRLLVKLVGTTGGLSNKQVLSAADGPSGTLHRTLQSYFRAPLMTEVKSYLASVIKEKKINILEIDEHMATLSEALRERVAPRFEEYGLTIPEFFVTNVALPEDDKNFQAIRNQISSAYLKVKEAEIAANVAMAEREAELTRAQTAAQLEVIKAQGAAEAAKLAGFAEAEVMHAKGFNQKDVLEADVQKAYAAGLGNMGSGGGGGGGGGIASEMVSLMAGMKVAEGLTDRMGAVLTPNAAPAAAAAVAASAAADEGWTCACGHAGNKGKFCEECGAPKAEEWTCACGHAGNKGKFCEECGAPKPTSWDCSCGQKNNTGKCCPNCGSKRPE
ncbi:MAG: SPFH domain-containing protein [Clostridia bacterium]|nr:SPFH domain-containing protein [Clostridia bacterium]